MSFQDPASRVQVGSHGSRDRTVVSPVGALDLGTRDVFRDALAACDGHVVIDLSGVTFLDSSVLDVLVVQRTRLVATFGSLELQRPRPWSRKVLEAVGLDAWITD